ncbi:glycosyl hydrolase family 65 protein [Tichowtungia aerotolerans]|uniref:Glycoside hydrolase family 65 C-terminal domain-containing protein n=1 Tax=Tichowtungia aerotolerans TaxID=2697043 RepID=A0A6P1MF88_9BACT|nr:glycosyl hydrolase family 65 protein [Tichowtungia aerotolerans]QHI70678.1 hypothetical protein GT409_14935 [Tichowtungia aerotolerans]
MKKKVIAGMVLLGAVSSGFSKGTVGENVTQFEFANCPQSAAWFNGYVQSFFTNRIDIGPTIFPREYLAISDCWLNDAQREGESIQKFTRDHLLADQVGKKGYVASQQHGASSHDLGWPFPHWVQVPLENGFRGVTAGWHFYDNKLGWEICYDPAREFAPEHFGEAATERWSSRGVESRGINQKKNAWELKALGETAVLTSPEDVTLDPFNCPYIQIRWEADCAGGYLEWMREGDKDWSPERRTAFSADWLEGPGRSESTGMFHSIIPLFDQPQWAGKITRIRFVFQGLEKGQALMIRSVFTHWDTRHLVNNAIYIKAAFEYFRWSGDQDFLETMMPRLRTAMRFMMEEGHGRELNHIRCTWHGHDGRPGYTVTPDGTKTFHVGHGKGGNYWDLLPFGWDDMYTTTHYYASLLAMAELEEVAPGGMDPAFLRKHAADVKVTANQKFWNETAGRFVGSIDADGVPHDYGFTFVNLEAVHYGIATEEHAEQILEWVSGERIVEGDTSTGADIYAYHLAPRATTKRNVEWYAHAWTGPETLPFGGQVQDGGAVLGFSFYDIMSRIKVCGADDAWKRLMAIRTWDEEVQAYGGYRKYYGDGKGGTTLQGGGTAGGVGIDFEFTESSMLSAVVPLGFMGLRPDGQMLHIEPNLPEDCPQMTVRNLLYCGVPMDVTVSPDAVKIIVHKAPAKPLSVVFNGEEFELAGVGMFER